jgi:hypothetical protein
MSLADWQLDGDVAAVRINNPPLGGPASRGGPMFTADQIGLRVVTDRQSFANWPSHLRRG